MSAVVDSGKSARIRISAERRALWVDGQPVVVGPRAFDLLRALVERRDRVVGKNELLELVWPRLVVEEANLHVQVSTLRKILGHNCIATIPGRGYRFMAPIDGAEVAGLDADASAWHEPDSVRVELKTNLPQSLPRLIGRADDLTALGGLIASRRLITVTGAGGMGKTRVAMQLLHDRRNAFEHGVSWVDLSGLSDPGLVAMAIAGAVGLQSAGGDPLGGLVAGLRPLSMLVAFDNAEHLIDEVARVAQAIVEGAPQVRLLVTSQVPLGRPDEQVYRLGSLQVPEGAATLDEAMACAAVQLFFERARAADRHFALTADNVAGVVDLCRRLDGLALAIELAAARIRTLGVARLAAGLDERLRLLTGGSRGAPRRQRTLRAALEWSHSLLSPVEQTVFRRLSVFVGGFALETAQQVVSDSDSDGGIDRWAVVDALGALVDRSLVAADTVEPPRYRLLESARAFALECLDGAGESAECRRRHGQAVLAHFTTVTADCRDGRIGVDASRLLLEPDLDNARETLKWGLTHSTPVAVALAPMLAWALTRDRHEEKRRLWESTAGCVTDDLPADTRAAWALGFAFYWGTTKPAVSLPWAHRAVELHRGLGDSIGLYLALAALGTSIPMASDAERLDALHEMRAIEDVAWPPVVKFDGALAELRLAGDLGAADEGERVAQRLLALAERAGDEDGKNIALHSLAGFASTAGRADAAVHLAGQLEARLRNSRNGFSLGLARLTLASALLVQREVARAGAVAALGWSSSQQFDLQPEWADVLVLLSALQGRPRGAARLCGYSEATYARYGTSRPISCARDAQQGERISREQVGDAEFERLKAEGAAMSDDEVAAVAFGVTPVA